MRKSFLVLVAAAAMGSVINLSAASAQQAAFDSQKFFNELSARSVNMPAGFDSRKFFDELSAKSVSSGKKFDAKSFFNELESRGVKMPAGFDSQKFFSDIASTSSAMPPMVEMKQ